jgi:murein DD-endopeptidase MepM/ murein hydrolase activator NlpD
LALCALVPAASANATDSSGGASASGPVLINGVDATGGASDKPLPIRARPRPHHRPAPRHRRPAPRPPVRTSPSTAFPVAGRYSYGTAANRFGAPRTGHTHQGQDVLAAEGTPLVSPVSGRVLYRAYQRGGAGNYVVIHGSDHRDYVMMHLQSTASVSVGSAVRAGQRVGRVGHTGDAQGSHLHFEIWVGGWYAGGHPIDPLPYLRRWAR